MTAFSAARISEAVHWVGALDFDLRDFHGYLTGRGTTYNAYLVRGETNVLIDAVKAPYRDELISRLRSVIPLDEIDVIVSLHSEMDHSGCLPDLIQACRPDRVLASPNGVKALREHLRLEGVEAVADGQTLDLGGGRRLTFLHSPMIHWPDSMMAHLSGDDVLFSQDGFGQHLATSDRFDDQVNQDVLWYETAKYFANILMPFSAPTLKLTDRIAESGLPLRVIAPDHGVVWRSDPVRVVRWTRAWCDRKPTDKVVVVAASMWGSTERMAHAVADGLQEAGLVAKVMPLASNHRSDVATEMLTAGALVVGTPTINNNLFPTVADLLSYLKGLKPKNLIGGAFGSFGWSGEGAKQVQEALTAMKIECSEPPLAVRYVPGEAELEACHAFGGRLAQALKARNPGTVRATPGAML